MPEREEYNSQPLHKLNMPLDLSNQSNWSPPIEKELLKELKTSIKSIEDNYRSKRNVLYLLIGALILLSIGFCSQVDSIAQALREVARTSVQQITPHAN